MTADSADLHARAESADPSLQAALAWTEAHSQTMQHCMRQQRLEARLGRSGHRSVIARRAYDEAIAAEQLAAETEAAHLNNIARTPASSLTGIAAKLAVIVREAEDNTDLSEFPVVHVRSALDDLRRLMDQATSDQLPVLAPGMTPDGRLVPASPSLAAWCAFQAWSQADEKRYRIWMTAFRALIDL
ncbi:hypothetical protein [Mesorhizobium australicum]|uniref:Uncharacterized protein n=1 Tax=Mesorhizobium australicum TaxID=536018 RepID=A0A1X7NR86_9HYPH|nr:hypothetical protein [Mesorhizobium australicum]SMH40570.1 hypothetical protein SAMN02982922_2360 [Mesorhizobium australicum]